MLVIVVAGAGYYLFSVLMPNALDVSDKESAIRDADAWKRYQSSELKFFFSYPQKYFLEEKDIGNGERFRTSIILTEDTEENRTVREGRAGAREGPVAITIDVFQNNLDKLGAEEWIRGTNNSNFKLSSDGLLTKEFLGGRNAFRYRWSGLYEGESAVVSTLDNVYMFSVTFLAHSDTIREAFASILKTVEFE